MAVKSIVYRLDDPGATIYHRAAMGGLAATIRAWNKHGVPEPLSYAPPSTNEPGVLSGANGSQVAISMDAGQISLHWGEKTSHREALSLLLIASFERTQSGMIFLPGLGFVPDREEILIAVHNGVAATFLQHHRKRPGSGVRKVALFDPDSGALQLLSHNKVDKYSHQFGQGTGLLGEGWTVEEGEPPDVASITQSLMPGATGGARSLDTTSERAFLLHYLMVACPVVSLRPRNRSPKIQNCLVVPDVTDLQRFAMRLHRAGTSQMPRFSNTYLGRVVGGAEDAALRFLIDLRGLDAGESLGVSSVQVVAMGEVAWAPKQQNRSWIARIEPNRLEEMGVFEAAASRLGVAKWIKTGKGDSFAVPDCPVPELVAANLAGGEHWCAHFGELVSNKKDFASLLYRKEGLRAMNNAIQDRTDRLVIERFQKAWEMTMGALGERASGKRDVFYRLVEVERERIRNDLLRARTHEQLSGWLLNFMARASRKQGSPEAFKVDSDIFRQFLFNPRNTDRLKNLLLFALVSYASDEEPDGDLGGEFSESQDQTA
jgi:CRISPR-associated protein Cas8a1/Csx13